MNILHLRDTKGKNKIAKKNNGLGKKPSGAEEREPTKEACNLGVPTAADGPDCSCPEPKAQHHANGPGSSAGIWPVQCCGGGGTNLLLTHLKCAQRCLEIIFWSPKCQLTNLAWITISGGKKYRVLWKTNLCQEIEVWYLFCWRAGEKAEHNVVNFFQNFYNNQREKDHTNHYWHLGQLEAHSLGCVRSHGIGWSHPRTGVLPMIWRWWTLADQKKTRKVCEENVVRVMDSAMVWGNTCFH